MADRHDRFAVFMVGLLAVFSTMPLLQPYFFASSDGLFHLYRLMEYHTVLSDGVLYPRWAPDFFFGLGLPLFNFYAPLTYYLGEIFHLLGAGYIDSLRLLAAAAMVSSGIGAYLYARIALSPPAALLAAVVYQYVPYHLVNLYYRGDLPEYLAYTWFPLILWSMVRLTQRKRFGYLCAGIVFYAALILTHNLSAFIFSGFLVVYAVAMLLRQWHDLTRSSRADALTASGDEAAGCGPRGQAATEWRTPLRELLGTLGALLAMTIGAWALTAFFWLPALVEKSLVNFDRLLLHYDFREHFPTLDQLLSTDLLHRYGVVFRGSEVFGYKLGLLQIVFLMAGLGILVWRFRRLANAVRIEAIASLVVTGLALFFIFPISLEVWNSLPLLSLTQFPWRFLAFVALPSAFLAGLIVESCAVRPRWIIVAAVVPLVIVSSVARLSPIMSNVKEADISPLGSLEFELTQGAIGTSAAAEYVPFWVKNLPASSPGAFDAVLRQEHVSPAGRTADGMSASLLRRKANEVVYEIRSDQGGDFVPNLLYFPGWTAFLDGAPVTSSIDDLTGLIKIAVPPGNQVLTLQFEETPLRRASDIVSGIILVAIILLFAFQVRAWRRSELAGAVVPRRKPILLGSWVRRHTQDRAWVGKAAIVVGVLLVWGVAERGYDAGVGLAEGDWRPLVANLDDEILLQGYDLQGVQPSVTSAVRVAAGSQFSVTVAWRLLADQPPKRYKAFVRLTNSHEQTWAYAEAHVDYQQLSGNRRQQVTTLPILVPPGTPPGIYQIEVGFENSDLGRLLAPRSVRVVPMLPGEQGVRMGTLIVDRAPPSLTAALLPAAKMEQPVNFGYALRLLDVAIADGEALATGRPGRPLTKGDEGSWAIRAGQVVHLDLLWQALGKPADDFTVTARLASQDGLLWTVRDSQPADGKYPTSYWMADEVARDQLNLVIGPETPPGRYELQLEVVSRFGPLSILDRNQTPVGPTLRVGTLAVLPSPAPAVSPRAKMQLSVDRPMSDGLSLVGYTLGRVTLLPGEQLRVDTLWRATKPPGRDVAWQVAVLDAYGKAWGGKSAKLGGDSYPTSVWREGELIRQQTDLALPGGAPAGTASVAITLFDSMGQALGGAEVGEVRVLSRERMFSARPSSRLERVLDDKMKLLGFDVVFPTTGGENAPVANAGQALTVRLYWQGLAEMSTNYTVFAQVLNIAGKLVAQHDAQPGGGLAPTIGWVKDEVVVDEHVIALPDDLPDGDYSLIAGVYDAVTGRRLAVAGGDDGDAIRVTPLKVAMAR